uniref:chitinase n=1 Tax=Oryza sativa subsp. japonica TaxID=39947 RepID=A0A060BG13_ORYSJ|nr:chitinase 5 [Oryza sativa Japonica Group]
MPTSGAAASLAKKDALVALAVLAAALATAACAEQCGAQTGGARCPNWLCCSRWSWCGSTSDFCGDGCQSHCSGCGPTPTPPSPSGGVGSIVPRDLFERLLLHRNDGACRAAGFYTYEAFLRRAAFPAFGGTGDTETRKREVAAFLGQTSHETTGGWPTAPDGPFSWGYCFKQEQNPPSDYCQPFAGWPCAPGRKYYGRGPIQLSFNINYGPAGRAIGVDLLSNPDLVATDATVSFKTALWYWMTPQGNKPSSHDVVTGRWTPRRDVAAVRTGYGVITNIVNGGLECGDGPDDRVANRIGFYQAYCGAFGIGTGGNLDGYPFNSGSSVGL